MNIGVASQAIQDGHSRGLEFGIRVRIGKDIVYLKTLGARLRSSTRRGDGGYDASLFDPLLSVANGRFGEGRMDYLIRCGAFVHGPPDGADVAMPTSGLAESRDQLAISYMRIYDK